MLSFTVMNFSAIFAFSLQVEFYNTVRAGFCYENYILIVILRMFTACNYNAICCVLVKEATAVSFVNCYTCV